MKSSEKSKLLNLAAAIIVDPDGAERYGKIAMERHTDEMPTLIYAIAVQQLVKHKLNTNATNTTCFEAIGAMKWAVDHHNSRTNK